MDLDEPNTSISAFCFLKASYCALVYPPLALCCKYLQIMPKEKSTIIIKKEKIAHL